MASGSVWSHRGDDTDGQEHRPDRPVGLDAGVPDLAVAVVDPRVCTSWSYGREMVDVPLDRFEELVADALELIPADLADHMENVVVLVEDHPDEPGLLGRYDGIPLTERGEWYGTGDLVLPRSHHESFARPLCALCHTSAEIVEQVAITVVHEVGPSLRHRRRAPRRARLGPERDGAPCRSAREGWLSFVVPTASRLRSSGTRPASNRSEVARTGGAAFRHRRLRARQPGRHPGESRPRRPLGSHPTQEARPPPPAGDLVSWGYAIADTALRRWGPPHRSTPDRLALPM